MRTAVTVILIEVVTACVLAIIGLVAMAIFESFTVKYVIAGTIGGAIGALVALMIIKLIDGDLGDIFPRKL